jgi:hypothetical protein
MPVLNHPLYKELCDLNKDYLRSQNLIIDTDELDIELGDNHNQIIDQLIENEKLNKQKENFKAKYVMQLMTIAFMLLAAGFTLASFFIATLIVLPILPILLIGFAILASIKFILSIKNNSNENHVTHIANTLDQLRDIDANEENGIRNVLDSVNELKSIIVERDEKRAAETTQNTAQLLAALGKFPETILHSDPANEPHDKVRTSSPTNS